MPCRGGHDSFLSDDHSPLVKVYEQEGKEDGMLTSRLVTQVPDLKIKVILKDRSSSRPVIQEEGMDVYFDSRASQTTSGEVGSLRFALMNVLRCRAVFLTPEVHDLRDRAWWFLSGNECLQYREPRSRWPKQDTT